MQVIQPSSFFHEVAAIAQPATKALPELQALGRQHPDGTRVKMGAQPHQLAAVVEVVE